MTENLNLVQINVDDDLNGNFAELANALNLKVQLMPAETIILVPTDFGTIQEAIDYLEGFYLGGNVYIQVEDGTYNSLSSITCNHFQSNKIIIQGNSSDISLTSLSFVEDGFINRGNGLKIQNLTITGAGLSTGIGIFIENSKTFVINCNISNFKTCCYSMASAYLYIKDSTLTNSTSGIFAFSSYVGSANVVISYCTTGLDAGALSCFAGTYSISNVTNGVYAMRNATVVLNSPTTISASGNAIYATLSGIVVAPTSSVIIQSGSLNPAANTDGNHGSYIQR